MEIPFLFEYAQESVDQVSEVHQLGDGLGSATGAEFVDTVDADGRGRCIGIALSSLHASGGAKVSFYCDASECMYRSF